MVLDLAGDATASAKDTEFDVLVVGGVGHVGAGEEDVAVVDDDGLGVELGAGRLAAIEGPVVDAVLGVRVRSSAAVEVLWRLEDEADRHAACDRCVERSDD